MFSIISTMKHWVDVGSVQELKQFLACCHQNGKHNKEMVLNNNNKFINKQINQASTSINEMANK